MTRRKPKKEPVPTIPRCAIYLRCSADKQAEKDLSIPAQRDACRAAARERGWEVVSEYEDAAESARTDDRPAFREMLGAARSKPRPFDFILVWKFSRFARNREHSVLYKRQLERNGVKVISLNEPIEDSPAGRMLEGILEVIDEFHSANLAQDVERGMRKNASMGFRNGGPPPIGYCKVRSGTEAAPRMKLEPDPTWAPIVQRMFKLVLDGVGVNRVAQILNEEGHRTVRGREWTKTRVHAIVTNEVYIGINHWGLTRSGGQAHKAVDPVRIENAHEALVSPEDFARTQTLLASRAPKVISPNILRSDYLLSGLLFCARCGQPFIGHAAKSGRNHYYGCQSKLKKGTLACSSQMLPQEQAERAVIEGLRSSVLTAEYLKDLVDRVNAELASGSDAARSEVEALEAQHKEAQRKLDRLYEALESGMLELADIAPRIRENKARVDSLATMVAAAREELRGQVIHLADEETVAGYLDSLHELLDQGTPSQKRSFLRSFIRRIEADGRTLTVHYELPPLPGPGSDRLRLPKEEASTEEIDGTTEVLSAVGSGDPRGIRTLVTGM